MMTDEEQAREEVRQWREKHFRVVTEAEAAALQKVPGTVIMRRSEWQKRIKQNYARFSEKPR